MSTSLPIKTIATRSVANIAEWIYPPRCVACRKDQSAILARDALVFRAPETQINEYLCADCFLSVYARDKADVDIAPSSISRLLAYGYYDDPVLEQAIKGLKFQRLTGLVEPLGELLTTLCLDEGVMPGNTHGRSFLLTPVPLSQWRLRWRGFNQAGLLTEYVSAQMQLPMAQLTTRVMHTPAQSTLSKAARTINVAHAFTLIQDDVAPIIQQFDVVVIIDDVWTTGSTMNAVASVLAPYCKEVWGLVLAA